jgi:hypothetical protein
VLDDKIGEYIDIISKAAMKAGPQVMQFAIQHEHWCGVGDIAIGFAFLFFFFVAGYIVKRNWAACYDASDEGWIVVPVIASVICFGVACLQLLNIWNWVAVFNPKIALFHDILTKFLSK